MIDMAIFTGEALNVQFRLQERAILVAIEKFIDALLAKQPDNLKTELSVKQKLKLRNTIFDDAKSIFTKMEIEVSDGGFDIQVNLEQAIKLTLDNNQQKYQKILAKVDYTPFLSKLVLPLLTMASIACIVGSLGLLGVLSIGLTASVVTTSLGCVGFFAGRALESSTNDNKPVAGLDNRHHLLT